MPNPFQGKEGATSRQKHLSLLIAACERLQVHKFLVGAAVCLLACLKYLGILYQEDVSIDSSSLSPLDLLPEPVE